MQQSGGLLLAAGLDGGNTVIFAKGENANESPQVHHEIIPTCPGGDYFIMDGRYEKLNAARMSAAGEGWTEPNNNFRPFRVKMNCKIMVPAL